MGCMPDTTEVRNALSEENGASTHADRAYPMIACSHHLCRIPPSMIAFARSRRLWRIEPLSTISSTPIERDMSTIQRVFFGVEVGVSAILYPKKNNPIRIKADPIEYLLYENAVYERWIMDDRAYRDFISVLRSPGCRYHETIASFLLQLGIATL